MKNLNNISILAYTREMQTTLANQFDCGNMALSAFLRSNDALDCSYGKTYVLMIDDALIGYYNISTGDVSDKNHIRYGGAVYPNCFALDKKYQGAKMPFPFHDMYIADYLLIDCIEKSDALRTQVGFSFITLSSTSEGLNLYTRNGFCPLEDDMMISKNQGEDTCVSMYLPIDYEE